MRAIVLGVFVAGVVWAQPGRMPDGAGGGKFGFGRYQFEQKDAEDLGRQREYSQVFDDKKIRKVLERALVLVPAFKTPKDAVAVALQGGEVESEDGRQPLWLMLMVPPEQAGDPEAFFQKEEGRPYAQFLGAMRRSGSLDGQKCDEPRECLGKGGTPERCLAWKCGR